MTTASPDLSRQLYELSGWEAEHWWERLTHGEWVQNSCELSGDVPAYDLGYLLRKLPDGTQLSKTTVTYSVSGIYSVDARNKSYHCNADTPEDAACLLAIKLFTQGVLKRN